MVDASIDEPNLLKPSAWSTVAAGAVLAGSAVAGGCSALFFAGHMGKGFGFTHCVGLWESGLN